MQRRRSILLALSIFSLSSLVQIFSLPVIASESPPPRLNLLLITIDTLRADRVSFYSSRHVRTQQIDDLASKGVVFTRAFSHNSTTLPAHTNILLGTTPSYHGVHDNGNFAVQEGFLTLAEHLKKSGYSTAAFIGGFPLESRFGLDQGFDTYDDRFDLVGSTPGEGGTRRAEGVLAGALAWLKTRASTSPWFLWIHCWDPHDPYAPPEPYLTQYADRLYDGEVAYVDSVLGDLFRYLTQKGLYESSLIVFTGDHGESLGEHGEKTHGFLAYNATIWIPLIIVHPGLAHRVVPHYVSHVDIFPTVCDILEIPKPDFLQGISLLPVMKGGKPGLRPVYFESLSPYYTMGWAPIRGFIQEKEKYIDSPIPEIYDLEKDFDERKNLAESKTVAAKREKLEELVRGQSSGEAGKAGHVSDKETIEKLRSLGYLAGYRSPGKDDQENFGPEDDVKTLLPLHNKAMDALDLSQAGKIREGLEALREVISSGKNVSTAYLNLAFLYKTQGRLADASAVLKLGLEALPDNYYIFLEYITCLFETGEFDEAIRVFEAMRPPQIEFDPVIWNFVGLSWWKKGDDLRARECYEKSLTIDGDFAVSWYNLGNLHYSAFRKTRDRSQLERAEADFRKAVVFDPAYSEAFHALGVTLFQSEDYAGAISSLERALALNPNLHEALYFLGLIHFRKGDIPEACSFFKRFKLTPDFDLLSPGEKARIDDIISKCTQ